MKSIHIIYATGSGHTEYVVDCLMQYIAKKSKNLSVTKQYAEEATLKDVTKADLLILGSGSWNTGGVEGQMHPHMYDFLNGPVKDADLKEQPATLIALGDHRYYYTARAGEHMRNYLVKHNGKLFARGLTVVDEPYGQEEHVHKWADYLLDTIKKSS